MRTFSVVKDSADLPRPYYIVDENEMPLRQRGRNVLRRFKSERAAQRIAKLCNEAESYPHS